MRTGSLIPFSAAALALFRTGDLEGSIYSIRDGFKNKLMEFSIKGPDPPSQHP